jgi:hypothetical protein
MVQDYDFTFFFNALLKLPYLGVLAFLVLFLKVTKGSTQYCY